MLTTMLIAKRQSRTYADALREQKEQQQRNHAAKIAQLCADAGLIRLAPDLIKRQASLDEVKATIERVKGWNAIEVRRRRP